MTPVGLPVQLMIPSLNDQVSLSQLTFTKSASPRAFQPGPLPSMNALGSEVVSSARSAIPNDRMLAATPYRMIVFMRPAYRSQQPAATVAFYLASPCSGGA